MQPIMATRSAKCETKYWQPKMRENAIGKMGNLARPPLFCSAVWIYPVVYLAYVYFGALAAILCEFALRISPGVAKMRRQRPPQNLSQRGGKRRTPAGPERGHQTSTWPHDHHVTTT